MSMTIAWNLIGWAYGVWEKREVRKRTQLTTLCPACSVGQYPYNVLTKFSEFRLAYPSTQYYDCDMSKAECQSSAVIVALVTEAVA
jgi:hypothetical protein